MFKTSVTPWDRFLRTIKRPAWRTVHALTGQRLAMPVHYLDTSLLGAAFRVPGSTVSDLVPRDFWVPILDGDRQARLYVIAMEHRECDILHPYREVAVTVAGRLRDGGAEAHYCLHLPVTTEDARWPGVDNYGFPKYVAEIAMSLAGSRPKCAVSVAGEKILELDVGTAATAAQSWVFRNLTLRERTPVLSEFSCHGERAEVAATGGASIRFGGHPIGRELAALGVENQSASHFYCPQIRAVLSKPMALESSA